MFTHEIYSKMMIIYNELHNRLDTRTCSYLPAGEVRRQLHQMIAEISAEQCLHVTPVESFLLLDQLMHELTASSEPKIIHRIAV